MPIEVVMIELKMQDWNSCMILDWGHECVVAAGSGWVDWFTHHQAGSWPGADTFLVPHSNAGHALLVHCCWVWNHVHASIYNVEFSVSRKSTNNI